MINESAPHGRRRLMFANDLKRLTIDPQCERTDSISGTHTLMPGTGRLELKSISAQVMPAITTQGCVGETAGSKL